MAIFDQFRVAKREKSLFSKLNNFFMNEATYLKFSGMKVYQIYFMKMLIWKSRNFLKIHNGGMKIEKNAKFQISVSKFEISGHQVLVMEKSSVRVKAMFLWLNAMRDMNLGGKITPIEGIKASSLTTFSHGAYVPHLNVFFDLLGLKKGLWSIRNVRKIE